MTRRVGGTGVRGTPYGTGCGGTSLSNAAGSWYLAVGGLDAGMAGFLMAGMPSKGELSSRVFRLGSKSSIRGTFIVLDNLLTLVVTYEPVSKNIVSNRSTVF